jgi:hypothetical protein
MVVASAVGIFVSLIGLLATVVLFWLIGLVCVSLASCEERTVPAVIGRGFSLTFHDFGRTLLFGLILVTTVSMLSYPLSLPAVLLSLFEFFRQGMNTEALTEPMKAVPLYVLILTQAWESIVNMLLWPVTYLAFGLFYYDLRMRQEGVDVLQKLELLERPAT